MGAPNAAEKTARCVATSPLLFACMCAQTRGRSRLSAVSSFNEPGHTQHGVAQVAEVAARRPSGPRPQRERRRLPFRSPPRHHQVGRHHRADVVGLQVDAAPPSHRRRGNVHRPRDCGGRMTDLAPPSRRRHSRRWRRDVAVARLVVVIRKQHLGLVQLLSGRHAHAQNPPAVRSIARRLPVIDAKLRSTR
uniref:Uncharacterized protein n=1 Tax=Leersia perrieri TaxID=77586 RepID=A0A0D9V568_9ORYZ